MEALLSKREVAELYRVSTRTIDRMRSAGQLRALKVRGQVRFRAADVERAVRPAK